jgi:hypothetical protein
MSSKVPTQICPATRRASFAGFVSSPSLERSIPKIGFSSGVIA